MTTAPTVDEQPLWFGPTGRPMFGLMATPADGAARGGVLLAPTIGREARASRRAFRRTALALADLGFVTLRFDYACTGDAGGTIDDPDLDRAWVEIVGEAASLLRSCAITRLSAIGMRLGATVVATATDAFDLDLSSFVLWDPCETGRGYLRELSALEALRREHVDWEADGSVVTTEYVFPEQAAADLRRLRLAAVERSPMAERLLVLTRPDRAVTDSLRARLSQERCEWGVADDQAAMLDVDPLEAWNPTATIERVVEWVAAEPEERTAIKDPADPRRSIVLREGTAEVVERTERIGESGLFGIVTEPRRGATGPLVVFISVSNEEHTGPSRLWVELSRRWAAAGLQCVRFDLHGLGDSPWLSEEREPKMYDQRWLADGVEVATALRPADPSDTVFVGLCSGAYLAVGAGRALRPRGVAVINPPIGIDFLDGTYRIGASRLAPVRALAPLLKEFALRLRWVAVAIWHVLRVILPPVFGGDVLSDVASGGTDLFVLATTEDLSPSNRSRRFKRFFSKRLVAPRNYEVTFVEGLDHAMHDAIGRTRAIAMLDAHILERYAQPLGAADDKERK